MGLEWAYYKEIAFWEPAFAAVSIPYETLLQNVLVFLQNGKLQNATAVLQNRIAITTSDSYYKWPNATATKNWTFVTKRFGTNMYDYCTA